ncbi:hypothetical protein HZA56_18830 [Candidatus Poribacteria bacterium]|nr:hypothetical protein [Candidatus Poribacteria bacterium]
MPLRPNMEPQEYLEIFRRRKWLIVFSILFLMLGASVYCVVTPEQFKSITTILVVPQRVPENYVRSTVSVKIEDRLSTIQQQVMSRTRLTTVMEELGLFREERAKMPVEEVIAVMRKRIEIEVRGTDAFTLSFVHENRQLAMLTTSRLASFFIDENLKAREQQAVGTSEFLDSQLKETKAKLEAQEEKVKQYKMRFMGELPQQVEANLGMLTRHQDQFRTNADAIRGAEDRKAFLEAQISSLEAQIRMAEKSARAVTPRGEVILEPVMTADPAHQLVAELNAKRAKLDDLSARYTDRYPEVQKVRREMESLEKRIAEVRQSAPSPPAQPLKKKRLPGTPEPATARPIPKEAEEVQRLKSQVAALDLEISSLRRERSQIQKVVAEVEAKVERSPKREQEMIGLTRDYDNLKRSYDDLLKKKLDADISQNLEKRQKGEQFQILDPANLPEKPFKPNRVTVFAIAVLASLMIGFGGSIGLETLDPTLRGPRDFKHFFDLPILVSVPVFQGGEYARRQAIRKAAVLGGIFTFTAALTIFLVRYGERIRTILSF